MNNRFDDLNSVGTPEPQERHAKQARRQWLLTVILALSVLLVVLLLTAVVISGVRNEDGLKGTWITSEGTIIEFNGFGKGTLILNDDLNKFNYEINDDSVRIDFVSAQLSDTIYYFEFEDHGLVLVDKNGIKTFYELVGHTH